MADDEGNKVVGAVSARNCKAGIKSFQCWLGEICTWQDLHLETVAPRSYIQHVQWSGAISNELKHLSLCDPPVASFSSSLTLCKSGQRENLTVLWWWWFYHQTEFGPDYNIASSDFISCFSVACCSPLLRSRNANSLLREGFQMYHSLWNFWLNYFVIYFTMNTDFFLGRGCALSCDNWFRSCK